MFWLTLMALLQAGIAKVLRGWQKQSLFSGNALSEMQTAVGASLKHSSSLGTAEAAPKDVRGKAGKAEAATPVAALTDAAEELSEPSAGSIDGFVVPEAVLGTTCSALGPPDRWVATHRWQILVAVVVPETVLQMAAQCDGAARLVSGSGRAWITLYGNQPALICCTQLSAGRDLQPLCVLQAGLHAAAGCGAGQLT